MNETIEKYIAVFGLLCLWVALDYFKIADDTLRYTIMGLIASLTGYAGLKSAIGNLGNGKTPPQA